MCSIKLTHFSVFFSPSPGCEECLTLFQSNPDNINGPSFILDFQTSMGVQQRALLTLPYGLMIGRSSIPGAGIGVINHGPAVSPGMHFGPYEGEVTTKENAITSAFSWEVGVYSDYCQQSFQLKFTLYIFFSICFNFRFTKKKTTTSTLMPPMTSTQTG